MASTDSAALVQVGPPCPSPVGRSGGEIPAPLPQMRVGRADLEAARSDYLNSVNAKNAILTSVSMTACNCFRWFGLAGCVRPSHSRWLHRSCRANPTLTLEDDVAVTRRVIDACDAPVVLVGHSYGGAVITEAGTDDNVRGARVHHCVRSGPRRVGQHSYRRSASRCTSPPDPSAAERVLVPRPREVRSVFAADIPAKQAKFMADSQVP